MKPTRTRHMVGLLGIFVAAAVFVAVVLALLALGQRHLIFFPDRELRNTPASYGLPFEDVTLTTSDNVRLAAWWIPAATPRGALVFAHGNAGNIGDRLDFTAYFRERGLSVMLFDYRGYGHSEGMPSEAGTECDIDAAITLVTGAKRVPSERLILYGESLGGAVALAAAARHRPAALVVASTFTSVPEMAHVHYPWAPRALVRIRYDSLGLVPTLRCPVLVMHGPDDSIVPFSMGEALFRAAREPKRFAHLVGDHNDGGILVSPDAQHAFAALLDEVLPPS